MMLLWPVDVQYSLFQKNTVILCVFLPKFCISISIICSFQFLLGLTVGPREIENNAHANFGGSTKSIEEYLKKGLFGFLTFTFFFLFVG